MSFKSFIYMINFYLRGTRAKVTSEDKKILNVRSHGEVLKKDKEQKNREAIILDYDVQKYRRDQNHPTSSIIHPETK